VKRWLCERFPYAVIYRIASDGSIRVLAVAHHRRRPGYWRART
jgi:tRNA(Ile)-lysidine synthase TilS/MesJ